MTKFSLWNPTKNKDYYFIDRTVRDFIFVSGTGVFIHKYISPKESGETNDTTLTNTTVNANESTIQDVLLLENRDRKYDPDVYEIKGIHNLNDLEFNMRQFGAYIETDIIYLEIHINESIEKIGRKLMTGDVIEFPHLRDDALLDETLPPANKFYVIDEISRAANGYSATWYPHIYRIKLKPMPASQEYQDILNQQTDYSTGDSEYNETISEVISDYNKLLTIDDSIVKQADIDVEYRNYETNHYYMIPNDDTGIATPWVFAGDGIPPNQAILLGSGTEFPDNPSDNDWFLRTDFDPEVLFQRSGKIWKRREINFKKKWHAAHRILETYINNDNITNLDGRNIPEKTNIAKVVPPRAKF